MIGMTEQEMEQINEWLYNNRDKWQNWCGFRFLVPEEELPPLVTKYRDMMEELDKFYDKLYDDYYELSLNSDDDD